MVVVLVRDVGERLVLEKQTFVPGSVVGQSSNANATLPVFDTRQFKLEGIAPGNYILFAWPQEAQIEWAEPGFLRRFDRFATPVRLDENTRALIRVEHLIVNPE